MSHFTTVTTQIKDITALRCACRELGIEVLESAQARGYSTNTTRGDYVLRLKGPYDIALNKQPDGTYGLTEAGGTQNIMLSGVSFELLGFRKNIPNSDLPSLTWAYIHKILWVFAGVFTGGTAIYQFTHRKEKEASHD